MAGWREGGARGAAPLNKLEVDVANSGGLCLGAVAEGDGEVVRWGPQVGEGALEWGHVPGRAGVEHKAAGVARGWRRLGGEGSRLGWCRARKGDGGGEEVTNSGGGGSVET